MPSIQAKMISGIFKLVGVNKMLDKQGEGRRAKNQREGYGNYNEDCMRVSAYDKYLGSGLIWD